MLYVYFAFKFMLFFSIVRALVKFPVLGNHAIFLGILYSGLIGFLSYVFILTIDPNFFRAAWLLKINQVTGLSPWLGWLCATWLVSTIYFMLISKFDEGIFFWILLVGGVAVAYL